MFSVKVKLIALFLIAGLLSACASNTTQAPANTAAATQVSSISGSTPAAATGAVSFSKDIVPILDNSCTNCHGGDRIEEGLKLQTYNDILAGSKNGAVVVPGDASNSLLAQLVANHKMPKRGAKLTDPQVQLIIDWIDQGALNN